MDQYMALSKKDMMIHITLNELYNTHSLILQHIEALVRRSSPYNHSIADHLPVTK
jgi:Ras GTPase-activating-like protein IQGAP2/3